METLANPQDYYRVKGGGKQNQQQQQQQQQLDSRLSNREMFFPGCPEKHIVQIDLYKQISKLTFSSGGTNDNKCPFCKASTR